jgi:hypothetical protein
MIRFHFDAIAASGENQPGMSPKIRKHIVVPTAMIKDRYRPLVPVDFQELKEKDSSTLFPCFIY